MNFLIKFFVTFFWSGCFPTIGGTVGSFVSFLLLCVVYLYQLSTLHHIIIFFIIFLCSLLAISKYTKSLQNKDPKEVVIDEFLGMYLGFIIFIFKETFNFKFFFFYFILFRVFDITKPFPISFFELKFKNAFGVIFDDLIAAVFAVFVFYGIHFWL